MTQLAMHSKNGMSSGREQKTDGLWTHLGMMVTGGAGPAGPPSDGRVSLITLGQGQFQLNPPALSNLTYSQAQIQMLSQVGSPVSLGFHEAGSSALALYKPVGSNGPLRIRQSDGVDYPLAGAPGSVTSGMIAANAVQQRIASYQAAPAWNTPTVGWQETIIQASGTSTGVDTRFEANIVWFHSTVGAGISFAFYMDGLSFGGALATVNVQAAGYAITTSMLLYATLPAGSHRFAVGISNSGGTFSIFTGGASVLYVTEQKR